MTNARQRIANLLKDMGIACEGKGYSSAEIDGYCAGIELVEEQISQILKFIFINLAENNDLTYYKAFIKHANTKNDIFNRLGEDWGAYSKSAFYDEMSKIGGKIRISDDGVTFSEIPSTSLDKLGKFVVQYIPPFVEAKYNGTGLTFNKWASWGKSWIELDNMNLTFNIIDSLRGDEI